MNEIVNKFLLAGDKFMPEMHLKQPGSTYSSCGPFTKNNERIRKFKETGDTSYIYKNKLDKVCSQRRTASDKVFRDKAFNIAKNPKYYNIAIIQILQFYNNSFKKWLKYNVIEIYLIHNEGKIDCRKIY